MSSMRMFPNLSGEATFEHDRVQVQVEDLRDLLLDLENGQIARVNAHVQRNQALLLVVDRVDFELAGVWLGYLRCPRSPSASGLRTCS